MEIEASGLPETIESFQLALNAAFAGGKAYGLGQRTWVGLTDEEIIASNYPDGEENGPTIAAPDFELVAFARQIEAAHNIKERT